jgi:hypothetical protein
MKIPKTDEQNNSESSQMAGGSAKPNPHSKPDMAGGSAKPNPHSKPDMAGGRGMNTDIRIDVGFLDHWKTDTLIIECGAEGVLSLMRLWVFAAQNKPDGRLTNIQTELIERVAKWRGKQGDLLQCLIATCFIEQDADGIWCIHDWLRHNPYAANAEWRHERAKKANAALLDCMNPTNMDADAAIYLQESGDLIELALTQFNRWTPKEEQ